MTNVVETIDDNTIFVRHPLANDELLSLLESTHCKVKLEYMDHLFEDLELEDWSFLKKLDTSEITSLKYTFAYSNFSSCILIKDWNTSRVRSMRGLFEETFIHDTSPLMNWNIESLIDISSICRDCQHLDNISGIESFMKRKDLVDDLVFDGVPFFDSTSEDLEELEARYDWVNNL